MKESDFDAFVKMMIALCEIFNSQIYSPTALNLQFEALKEYSLTQISNGITKLLKGGKNAFIPTICEIIEAIEQTAEGGAGSIGKLSIEQQAEIQAEKVIEHLRRYGRTVSPQFQDPITKRLMAVRWSYYRWASMVEEADLKWWRKDFIKSYIVFSLERPEYSFLIVDNTTNGKGQGLKQLSASIIPEGSRNSMNNIKRAA